MKNKAKARDTYEHLHFWTNPADAPPSDGGTVENLDGIFKVKTTASKPPTEEGKRQTANDILDRWIMKFGFEWAEKKRNSTEWRVLRSVFHAVLEVRSAVARGDADEAAVGGIHLGMMVAMMDVKPFERYVQQVRSITKTLRKSVLEFEYPADFRQRVLDKFAAMASDPKKKLGAITKELAKEFNIGERTIDDWRKKAKTKV